MIRRTGMVLLGGLLAWHGMSNAAQASCKAPMLQLLWSYPADGQQDVPTNAAVWLVASASYPPKLSLDGVALAASTSSSEEVSLGQLLPQHDYTLRVDYEDGVHRWAGDDAGVPSAFEIHFRTGDGPATRPAGVQVDAVARSMDIDSSSCPDVVRAGECFDTGPNVLLTFSVHQPGAIGWLVDGKPWPARCGEPATFVHKDTLSARCIDVAPIGPGGLLGPTAQSCSPASPNAVDAGTVDASTSGGSAILDASPTADAAPLSTASDADSDSCNVGHRGGSGSALLLSLASLWIGKRRKRLVL